MHQYNTRCGEIIFATSTSGLRSELTAHADRCSNQACASACREAAGR